jgi:hypothetical protein
LEAVVKEVAQHRGKMDLVMYLLVMGSKLRKAEETLMQDNMWFNNLAAIALRGKLNDLQ